MTESSRESTSDAISNNRRTARRFFHPVKLGLFLLAALMALFWPLVPRAEELTCSRLPDLMEAFHDSHYALKTPTPEIRTHAVDQMIKRLDPSKTLLYESDIVRLKPLLSDLFNDARDTKCASLKPVYDLLVVRAKENEAIIKAMLGQDFQPDRKIALNLDIDKRPYPKTEAEKRELLRKIVIFQIENALSAGLDPAEARKQQIHRYELQTRRVVEQNPAELITTSAEAFARALDPHTSYLSPKNLEDLQISMRLSLEGIGAILSTDNGFTVIEELIPGGGAEKTGLLKPKDKIVAVAQEGEKPVDVIDMDLRDVISLIRGKKGTRVTLTILRQTEHKERFNVTILRDKIDVKEQEAKITYETRKVKNKTYRFGVIDFASFYGSEKGGKSSCKDIRKLLAEAKKQNVDGIVLDLSRNGGGLLDEAVRLTGLFVGRGGIVAVKDSRGQETILANGGVTRRESAKRDVVKFPLEDSRTFYTGPLVVLTSRVSASASEIVAGALKDYRRAVILGADHTYGKGSVQTLMMLPWGLGAMKVTTALYFLPGGRSTQKTGVAADVHLPGLFAFEDIGEGTLDYSLPSQTITPFLSEPDKTSVWRTIDKNLIGELSARSQARIAKDAKFAKIIKDTREAAEIRGLVQLEDYRKTVKKENGGKEKQTLSERKKKAREENVPYINESINVLLDMVALQTTH